METAMGRNEHGTRPSPALCFLSKAPAQAQAQVQPSVANDPAKVLGNIFGVTPAST